MGRARHRGALENMMSHTRPIGPGSVFGRLTVQRECARRRLASRDRWWLCQCRCGQTTHVPATRLRSGKTKSCGCLVTELRPTLHRTHGLSKSAEYGSWRKMIERCHNPNDIGFKNYGARGISVWPAWRSSFPSFLRDVGQRPTAAHTVERENNHGNYEPGNVKWATRSEQNRNRRNNVLFTVGNRTMTRAEVSRKTGLSPACLIFRRQQGWSDEEILTTKKWGKRDNQRGCGG